MDDTDTTLPPLVRKVSLRPTRSSSLPSIVSLTKPMDSTNYQSSDLDDDADVNLEPSPEALALRTAFLAYCRGHEWRASPSPNPAPPPLSASLSTSTVPPPLGLTPSPSAMSIAGPDGPNGPTMGLNHWMQIWADLGLPESHGGPVAGTVLHTFHAAYRPHNSARLGYMGFVQAVAALSAQLRYDLAGPVGRHGEALLAQQRYQWRVYQLQQLQVAQVHAAKAGRGMRSSWAGDEDLPDTALDLSPQDLAKERTVLTQLRDQLSQKPAPGERPDGAMDLGGWVPRNPPPPPPPVVVPPELLQPQPPQQPSPTGLTPRPCGGVTSPSAVARLPAAAAAAAGSQTVVAADPRVSRASGGGARGSCNGGSAALAGRRSPPKQGRPQGQPISPVSGEPLQQQLRTQGQQQPQQQRPTAAAGAGAGPGSAGVWVRLSADNAVLSGPQGGAAAAAAPAYGSSPYLQGLPRSKPYAPQLLKPLRHSPGGGDALDTRFFLADPSPNQHPPPPQQQQPVFRGDPWIAYAEASAASAALASPSGVTSEDRPDSHSSPLPGAVGPSSHRGGRVGGRGGGGGRPENPDSVAFPMTSGNASSAIRGGVEGSPKGTTAAAGRRATAGGVASAPNDPSGQPVRLPAVTGAGRFAGEAGGADYRDGSGGSGGLSPASVAAGGSRRVMPALAPLAASGPSSGGVTAAGAAAGAGAEAEAGSLAAAGPASLVARVERLERAAVSGETRMSHFGGRLRGLEVAAEVEVDRGRRALDEVAAAIVEQFEVRQSSLEQHLLAQQQQLVAAMRAVQAAWDEAAAARQDAAAAREEAAAARQGAPAAPPASLIPLPLPLREYGESATAASEGSPAGEAAAEEGSRKASEDADSVAAAAVAAAEAAAAKLVMPVRAELDELLRTVSYQQRRLDEQLGDLLARQRELLDEAARVTSEATEAAAEAAAAAAKLGAGAVPAPAAPAAAAEGPAPAPAVPADGGLGDAVASLGRELQEVRQRMLALQAGGQQPPAEVGPGLAPPTAEAVATTAAAAGTSCADAAALRVLVEALQQELMGMRKPSSSVGQQEQPAASEGDPGAPPAASRDSVEDWRQGLALQRAELETRLEEVAREAAAAAAAAAAAVEAATCARADAAAAATTVAVTAGAAAVAGGANQPSATTVGGTSGTERADPSAETRGSLDGLRGSVEALSTRPSDLEAATADTPSPAGPSGQAVVAAANGAPGGSGGAGGGTEDGLSATVVSRLVSLEAELQRLASAAAPTAAAVAEAEAATAAVAVVEARLGEQVAALQKRLDEQAARAGGVVVTAVAATEVEGGGRHRSQPASPGTPPTGSAAGVTADTGGEGRATTEPAARQHSNTATAAVAMAGLGASVEKGGVGDEPVVQQQKLPQLASIAAEVEAVQGRVAALEAAAAAVVGTRGGGGGGGAGQGGSGGAGASSEWPPEVMAEVQRLLDTLAAEVRQNLDLVSSAVARDLDQARLDLALQVATEVTRQMMAAATPVATAAGGAGAGSARSSATGMGGSLTGAAVTTAAGDAASAAVVKALQERLTLMESELADVCQAADMTTESVELLTRHLQTLEQTQRESALQIAELLPRPGSTPAPHGDAAAGTSAAPAPAPDAVATTAPDASAGPDSRGASSTAVANPEGSAAPSGPQLPGGGPAKSSSVIYKEALPVSPVEGAQRPTGARGTRGAACNGGDVGGAGGGAAGGGGGPGGGGGGGGAMDGAWPGASESSLGTALGPDLVLEVAELRAQVAEIQAQKLSERLQVAEQALRQATSPTVASSYQSIPATTPITTTTTTAAAAVATTTATTTAAATENTDPPDAAAVTPAAPGSAATPAIPPDLQALLLDLSTQVDSLDSLVREQEHGLDVLAQVAEAASNASRAAATRLDVLEATVAALRDAGPGGGSAAPSPMRSPGSRHSVTFRPAPSPSPEDAQAQAEAALVRGRLEEVEKGLEVRGAALAALSAQVDRAVGRLEGLEGRLAEVAMDAAAARAAAADAAAAAAAASAAGAAAPGSGTGAGGRGGADGVDGGEYEESADSYDTAEIHAGAGRGGVGRGGGGGGGGGMDAAAVRELQARLKAAVKTLQGQLQAERERGQAEVSELRKGQARLKEKAVLIDEVIVTLARRLEKLAQRVHDMLDADAAETMTAYSVIDKDRLAGRRGRAGGQEDEEEQEEEDYQAGVETPATASMPPSQVVSRSNSGLPRPGGGGGGGGR